MAHSQRLLTLIAITFNPHCASALVFGPHLTKDPPVRPFVAPALFMSPSDFDGGALYGILGSGWTSPDWNWGSAAGTGHDCALICRRRWSTVDSRELLVESLLNPSSSVGEGSASSALPNSAREPPFEEVKLVLALTWQNGRWDASDGGPGGYGEVLHEMACADRYEPSADADQSRALVEDMRSRFHLITSSQKEMRDMDTIKDVGEDLDAERRKCSGLVLRAMGFVQNGL